MTTRKIPASWFIATLIFSVVVASAFLACSSPDSTPTTSTPIPTQPPPTPTPLPPTSTPVPPTSTPIPEPTVTPTIPPTVTPTPEPTATLTPSATPTSEPIATSAPAPIVLTLEELPDTLGDCADADEFKSAFDALASGDTSTQTVETVDACYVSDVLAQDLSRYFGGIVDEVSDSTTNCFQHVAERSVSPSHAIPLLYGSIDGGSPIEAATVRIAVEALGCLDDHETTAVGMADLFGLPPSPGLAKGINCVSDLLNENEAATDAYVASIFKTLAGSTMSTEDALVLFDNLEPSASCGLLPANLAPIATQLTREDAACVIEQVGTEPLVSFFNFAPEEQQQEINFAAITPLLGALNVCEITIDLTAGR